MPSPACARAARRRPRRRRRCLRARRRRCAQRTARPRSRSRRGEARRRRRRSRRARSAASAVDQRPARCAQRRRRASPPASSSCRQANAGQRRRRRRRSADVEADADHRDPAGAARRRSRSACRRACGRCPGASTQPQVVRPLQADARRGRRRWRIERVGERDADRERQAGPVGAAPAAARARRSATRPALACQARPWRPRPAVWCSATSRQAASRRGRRRALDAAPHLRSRRSARTASSGALEQRGVGRGGRATTSTLRPGSAARAAPKRFGVPVQRGRRASRLSASARAWCRGTSCCRSGTRTPSSASACGGSSMIRP